MDNRRSSEVKSLPSSSAAKSFPSSSEAKSLPSSSAAKSRFRQHPRERTQFHLKSARGKARRRRQHSSAARRSNAASG